MAIDRPLALEVSTGGGRQRMISVLLGNRSSAVGLVVLVVLALLAVFGETLAPYGVNQLSTDILAAPSSAHWLGTDTLGRDLLSRILVGTRATLLVGLGAGFVGIVLGTLVGATAGYVGGAVDSILMRISELFQVIPNFFLAILVVALFGPGIGKVIVVIGVLAWPGVARLARGQFLSMKSLGYVEAARSIGLRDRSIAIREILPNAAPQLVVQLSFDIAAAILVEAGLGFLGLSDPNALTWGALLQDAQRFLLRASWLALFPGAAILIAVASSNLVGDGLNDALNPRRRGTTR